MSAWNANGIVLGPPCCRYMVDLIAAQYVGSLAGLLVAIELHDERNLHLLIRLEIARVIHFPP